ncbi:MAG: iron-containing alcohol dehydrogenase [Eubacterium sp.]|nr:iron-containing alcohol dehydrogenase [Eubacterium sp.]
MFTGAGLSGKTEEQLVKERLAAMKAWMKEVGLAMNFSELDVTEEMIGNIVDGTLILKGVNKLPSGNDIREVLLQAM